MITRIRSFWSNLSIRFKLLSYFFVILFFVSMFNVYLNNNNYNTMDQFNETMTNYYKINELMQAIQANYKNMDLFIREKDEVALETYLLTDDKIRQLVEELYGRFGSREAYFSLSAIKNSYEAYGEKWLSAAAKRQAGEERYYIEYYDGEAIYEYTVTYVQDLLYISLREGTDLYNSLAKEAEIMRRISLFLILMVFAIALIVGGVFSSYLVRPIKKLAKASRAIASGNLDVESVEIKRRDEVGVLADSFNTMSAAIRDYVEDLKQKVVIEKKLHEEELAIIKMEQLLKESEFQALQSQVNPHFLFNTLNTISRTAMFEEAEDTMKLIQSLSSLLRYRMKNSEASVTLQEEVALINEYMYLQKVRFKDRLTYVLKVEGDLDAIMIPVFTLQPLVENAIIHGIEPKIEGGTLRLKIENFKDRIRISITDTGNGMDKERARQLMEESRQKRANRIGVANVYNRFKLFYQDKGHFCIYSKEGLGTMIRLTIFKEGLDV